MTGSFDGSYKPGSTEQRALDEWTNERVVLLTRLVKEGYSRANIAVELNESTGSRFTRDAVIGKAHRLGVHSEVARVKQRKSPLPRQKPPEYSHAPNIAPQFQCEGIDPLHLTLDQIGRGQCRWPFGLSDYTFCGLSVLTGSSYCPAHRAEGTYAGTVSERAAHRISVATDRSIIREAA